MTPHVLDQLPLWVEGDLDAPDRATVERHLVQCPDCASAAGALQASQHQLRECLASPFSESDTFRLRLQVMERIRTEGPARPVRHLIHRPALLAACVASLLLGVLTWRKGSSPASQPVLPLAPTPPAAAAPAARPLPPATVATRGLTVPGAAPARPTPGEDAESPPRNGAARIEFQTADPSIHIIWLAQAKDLHETNAPLPEAP